MKEVIFTVEELAEYLKMNPMTIYRRAAAGEIPGFKIGRSWRFRKSAIDAWIAEQERSGRGRGLEKCCICQREFSERVRPGGVCEAQGCSEVICSTCWNVRGRHTCNAHESVGEEGGAESVRVKGDYPGGDMEIGLSNGDREFVHQMISLAQPIREREINFLGRFQLKASSGEEVRDPSGRVLIKGDSWGDAYSMEEESTVLRKMLKADISSKVLNERFPLNRSVRYRLPLGRRNFLGNARTLVIEGRSFTNLSALAEGRKPGRLRKDTLVNLIEKVSEEARHGRWFHCLGIYSPTGFTDGALELVEATSAGERLTAPNVAYYLIGPGIEQVRFNKGDERTVALRVVFDLVTKSEREHLVRSRLRDRLEAFGYVDLEPFSEGTDWSLDEVLKAAEQLSAQDARLVLMEIDHKPVLKRREGGEG